MFLRSSCAGASGKTLRFLLFGVPLGLLFASCFGEILNKNQVFCSEISSETISGTLCHSRNTSDYFYMVRWSVNYSTIASGLI